MQDLIPVLAIICIFVILPGMAFHYADRRRRWQREQVETNQGVQGDLIETAERMERRIESLEKILDAEAPGWRKRHHE